MLGLGFPELLIILVIIFLIFGAKRIPEIGTGLGRTVKELRKLKDERKADKEKNTKIQDENLISHIKKEVEDIPGLKEVKQIKEVADKIKGVTKILK